MMRTRNKYFRKGYNIIECDTYEDYAELKSDSNANEISKFTYYMLYSFYFSAGILLTVVDGVLLMFCSISKFFYTLVHKLLNKIIEILG